MRAGPAQVVERLLGRRRSPEQPHHSLLETASAAATLDFAWDRERWSRECRQLAASGLLRDGARGPR